MVHYFLLSQALNAYYMPLEGLKCTFFEGIAALLHFIRLHLAQNPQFLLIFEAPISKI